jgi:hypothetical protein
MYRPAKKYFEPNGYISLSGGYLWCWLKKDDDFQKNKSRKKLIWAEDGDRIFYSCPSCRRIVQSYCQKDGNVDSVINGRELDTIRCEACPNCLSHQWLTFENAISRKTAGAIRLRPNSCPFCKKSNTRLWTGMESSLYSIQSFRVDLVMCDNCARRWRTA